VPVTTCIHPRHGQEPPLADEPLMLCHHCHGRLRRDLDALIALWPLLDEMVTPGNNGSGGGAAGKPGSRPPCDLDAIDARDNATAVIGSWARVVIEDRQLSGRGSLDGESAARLLVIHLEWLTAQPFADDAATEVADVVHWVRAKCKDLPEPPLGKCPDIDPRGESDRCGGPLRWIDGSTAVACARCGSTWIDADLPHILRVVAPSTRFPVPRAWVAATYGVAPGTLRQWVRRGYVKTYSDEQVELFDVLNRITEG
jgi:hypothetical protein